MQHYPMYLLPLNLLYLLLSFDLTIMLGSILKFCPTNNKDAYYDKVLNRAVFLWPSGGSSIHWFIH